MTLDLDPPYPCDCYVSGLISHGDGRCGRPATRAFLWDGPGAARPPDPVVSRFRCASCPAPSPVLGVSSESGFRGASLEEAVAVEVMSA